jgi:hypothetical protein
MVTGPVAGEPISAPGSADGWASRSWPGPGWSVALAGSALAARCQPTDIGWAAGLAGTGSRILLGADRGEFALHSSADRGIGPQGLQAPRELVAVQVQLAGWEPADLAAVLVGPGRDASVPPVRWTGDAWPLAEIAAGVTHG